MKKFRDIITRESPKNIIHGTDWWMDCDDCVALRLLCRAHNEGVVRLLGVGMNAVMDCSAPSLSAMLDYDGVKNVPVGLDFSAADSGEQCLYQKLLAQYPHSIKSNSECEEAYKLYRRILAGLDGKADITEVGFPQIIMDLMKSGPDDISPKSGIELIKEKVGKIWMMAGRWDVENGKECNLITTVRSRQAGNYICENSPVPIAFLGFEVGDSVISGGDILDSEDPLFKAMDAFGAGKGRSSWDPMLTLAAIIDDDEISGYKSVRGTARVDAQTGENNFTVSNDGLHSYFVKQHPDSFYSDMINALIASK